ncbi:MAG: radical SAM protein [Planctomycetota bacterium]
MGCAKNLVDSERILGRLAEHGFLIAQDPAVADLCLVNTCGFIHDAREETAAVLSELTALKTSGRLKTLVALGCLVERVADAPELDRFLQAADARLGFKDYPRIAQICRELIEHGAVESVCSSVDAISSRAKNMVSVHRRGAFETKPQPKGVVDGGTARRGDRGTRGNSFCLKVAKKSLRHAKILTVGSAAAAEKNSIKEITKKIIGAVIEVHKNYHDFLVAPRLRIGSPHSAYLKISEGCSNHCRFCSIPRIRGPQISQPIEKLVAEARELAAGGAQEINLIAQDTTSYGRDLYGRLALAELLRALMKVKGPRWFRLMYAYPKLITAELLDVLAGDERFCPYIDLPLQHISNPILAAMSRGVTKSEIIARLDLIAQKLPSGAIRTTFIAGYPGETDEHVNELVAFVILRAGEISAFCWKRKPNSIPSSLTLF